ncbi:MAG: PEP-CTERM sorting domain-containing protein [Opitutales bacterium]|nr:PEP-CTERM sorting domain-containing protein [Opitutales bacterium]
MKRTLNISFPGYLSATLAFAGLFVFTASTVTAQGIEVIYADAFSRSGDLLNSAPETRPGSETWVAAAADRVTDGSVLNFTNDRGNAFLPFTPGSGIYELSVRVSTDPTDTGNNWHALGFLGPDAGIGAGGSANFAFGNNPEGAYAWALLRNNGGTATFAGRGTGGGQGGDGSGAYAAGEFHTLMIRLDTTDAQWSYQAFVNGNPVADEYTYPLGGNPNIGAVGLSTAGGTNNVYTYDDFQLTLIPEPSTYAAIFGGLAFVGMILRRRLRNSTLLN